LSSKLDAPSSLHRSIAVTSELATRCVNAHALGYRIQRRTARKALHAWCEIPMRHDDAALPATNSGRSQRFTQVSDGRHVRLLRWLRREDAMVHARVSYHSRALETALTPKRRFADPAPLALRWARRAFR